MGVFAYYDPDTDGTVYHVMPDSDSEYAPSSIYSEADSMMSGTTILSDDLPGYFVLHHGRLQAASENMANWFPSDNIRRYVIRYVVSKSVWGGHYTGPVRDILSPIKGRQRQALEVGTTTGTWVQAMASEFPHVHFRTLDAVPMIPHIPRHNITFEVYDFMEGLQLEDNSQDAVFLNVVIEVVRDYRALLREVYRVLRPGGIVRIDDYIPGVWDSEDPTIPAVRTNPHISRFSYIAGKRIVELGADPEICKNIPRWLAPDSELWGKNQKGFKDINMEIRMYPFHPHDGFPCMKQIDPNIAPYFRQLAATSMRDLSGLVKDSGLPDEEAEKLIEDVLEELTRHESCALFKVFSIHAIKM